MYRINYHHLFLFYTIAQEGSIAKASKKLLLAQPTLSMQLRDFEKHLNRRLFDRRNRRLSLTEEGRIVLRYAEAIFHLGKELADNLRDRPTLETHSIQVGVITGLPKAFSHAMLNSILLHDSKAQLSSHEGTLDQLLTEMREFRLDIILSDVCVSAGPQSLFTSTKIGRLPIIFAAKPSMAKRLGDLPGALDDAPILLPKAPSDIYRQLQIYFTNMKVRPHVLAEVEDVEVARRLAISGRGIAPMNLYTYSVSKPASALAIVGSGKSTGIHQDLYLVTLEKRLRHNPLTGMLLKNFRLPKSSSN